GTGFQVIYNQNEVLPYIPDYIYKFQVYRIASTFNTGYHRRMKCTPHNKTPIWIYIRNITASIIEGVFKCLLMRCLKRSYPASRGGQMLVSKRNKGLQRTEETRYGCHPLSVYKS